jgi:hypothetical protein
MYNSIFQELVTIAVAQSHAKELSEPNPFYIGFGNPNASLLLIGQEKAIDATTDKESMKLESTRNPYQWQEMIAEGIVDRNYEVEDPDYKVKALRRFKNPSFPYTENRKGSNTWNHYQLLVKRLFPDLEDYHNSFFTKTFITEINHEVSKKKLKNQDNPKRKEFMSHRFFKSFPMTIIAAGNYLSVQEIEERFDVQKVADLSQRSMKLQVFENQEQQRVVLSTRQFSNFYFNQENRDAYFGRICTCLQKYNALSS